jgi:hypothetical protein
MKSRTQIMLMSSKNTKTLYYQTEQNKTAKQSRSKQPVIHKSTTSSSNNNNNNNNNNNSNNHGYRMYNSIDCNQINCCHAFVFWKWKLKQQQ